MEKYNIHVDKFEKPSIKSHFRNYSHAQIGVITLNINILDMVSQTDIDEFGDLWSLMYCVFAREIVDSFDKEGKKALIRAVKSYGKARGERLRKRHEQQGLPINLKSLFEHYDLPGHSGTSKKRTRFDNETLVSYTYECPYEKIWRSRDCNDVGLIYCQYFHHAFWQAYKADIDVQIPEILTKDHPHCLFVVTQPKEK